MSTPFAARRLPARYATGLATALAVGAAVTVLGGCGLRLETPAPTVPTPDAAEVQRQELAVESAHLLEAATGCLASLQPTDAAYGTVANIASHAEAHDALWGGVWVAFPSTSPADDETAGSATTSNQDGPAGCDLATLASELGLGADTMRQRALDGVEPDQSPTFAAIATSRYLDLAALQRAEPTVGGRAVPVKADPALTLSPDVVTTSTDVIAAIVRGEDAAGYGDEFVAARLPDPPTTTTITDQESTGELEAPPDPTDGQRAQIIASAAAHRAQAAAMAQAWGTDPRAPLYQVPSGAAPDQLIEVATAFERDLASTYQALALAGAGDLSSQAFDAMVAQYDRVATAGVDLGAFPGLVSS